MTASYVVTGGANGIGAAIAGHLRARGDAVVTVDLAPSPGPHAVTGDAAAPEVVAQAADLASSLGPLTGWVNNAAAGVRVNAVALGSVATERYSRELDPQMAVLHPVGRAGTPAEVAAAVAYLLSAEAAFVSGAVLPVDGGRAAQGQDPEARRLGE